jgi:hypothetical protein
MVKFKKEKNKEMALWFIVISEYTRDSGLMIIKKDLELKNFQTIAFLRECTQMTNLKEQEVIIGQVVNIMTVNGIMDSNTVLACGEA